MQSCNLSTQKAWNVLHMIRRIDESHKNFHSPIFASFVYFLAINGKVEGDVKCNHEIE